MTPKTILQEALCLPIEDRLTLVEQIWDSIAADSAKVPVPDWHKAELDRRMADPNPERLTWAEHQRRLDDREKAGVRVVNPFAAGPGTGRAERCTEARGLGPGVRFRRPVG